MNFNYAIASLGRCVSSTVLIARPSSTWEKLKGGYIEHTNAHYKFRNKTQSFDFHSHTVSVAI